jgi:hypothetical protein
MFDLYQSHFEWRAQAFTDGRYDDLAKHYQTPLTLRLGSHHLYVGSHDDMVLNLHRLRLALLERGMTKLRPQVIAVELPGTLQRVWVEWHASGGGTESSSKTIYQIDRQDGWMRVVSAKYLSLLLPELETPSFHNRLARSRG